MRHGSLFSGIGGFDLAAEWMGWENVFHCEINEFNKKVLRKHFKDSISYGNIKETDFTKHKGSIDVLTGGFPCQPYSGVGQRKGKEDDRHLWPEMLRAIGEIQPPWVVGENVRGFINWSNGLVFDEVQDDLEAKGYEIAPFLLPSCAVDANHVRTRIFIIAHSKSFRRHTVDQNKQDGRKGFNMEVIEQTKNEWRRFGFDIYNNLEWPNDKSIGRLSRNDDGLSKGMDRLNGIGNAIVPQVVYEIFKAIQSVTDNR